MKTVLFAVAETSRFTLMPLTHIPESQTGPFCRAGAWSIQHERRSSTTFASTVPGNNFASHDGLVFGMMLGRSDPLRVYEPQGIS
jgi:hypothetical protein